MRAQLGFDHFGEGVGAMPNTVVIFVVLSSLTCTMPRAAHGADPASGGTPGSVEAHRAPVPILGKATESPPAPESPQPPSDAAEHPAPAELTSSAAKAAVEADGYKRVGVLGQKPNGIWRMKAYREKHRGCRHG